MNESADLRVQLATLEAQRAEAETVAATAGGTKAAQAAACCRTTPRSPSKKAAAPCLARLSRPAPRARVLQCCSVDRGGSSTINSWVCGALALFCLS